MRKGAADWSLYPRGLTRRNGGDWSGTAESQTWTGGTGAPNPDMRRETGQNRPAPVGYDTDLHYFTHSPFKVVLQPATDSWWKGPEKANRQLSIRNENAYSTTPYQKISGDLVKSDPRNYQLHRKDGTKRSLATERKPVGFSVFESILLSSVCRLCPLSCRLAYGA